MSATEETTTPISENGCEVYIRGLPTEVTEEDLSSVFGAYGTLEKVRVKSRPKGSFAFLLYAAGDGATAAINAMNGQAFNGGEALEVALAREPRKRQRPKRALGKESTVQIFCANLPWGMDDDGLNAIFAGSGDLEECTVVKKPDGRSRGFGFVKFVNESDAAAAVAALDGHVMGSGSENERPLRLQFARELLQPDPNADPAPAAASSSAPARRSRKPRADAGPVPNQIYCSNLPADFRASHLKSMFADYTVVTPPFISRRKGPRSRYGFIVLGTEEEVNAAINDMNGAEFTSEGDEDPWALKLEKARPRAPAAARPAPVDDSARRIFVKGFPPSFNKEDLIELFQDFGEVQNVKLRKKGKRGGPFAHLVFKTREEALDAVQQRHNQDVETDEVDEEGNKFVLVCEESRPRARAAGAGAGGKRRQRRPRKDAGGGNDAPPLPVAAAATAADCAAAAPATE